MRQEQQHWRGMDINAYLALHTSRLFLAFERAIELAHACRAHSRRRQRAFYLPRSLGLYRRFGGRGLTLLSMREILHTLALVLSHAHLARGASFLRWIIIRI